ncbi:Transposon Tf2-6 polyprotein, partial [Trichinella zimbabwensis]
LKKFGKHWFTPLRSRVAAEFKLCKECLENDEERFRKIRHFSLLRFRVCSQGIKLLAEKVAAIRQFSKPSIMHELRQFLGCVNFHRRFIPRAATLLAPLERLISALGKNKRLKLTEDVVKAFEEVKQA